VLINYLKYIKLIPTFYYCNRDNPKFISMQNIINFSIILNGKTESRFLPSKLALRA